MKAELQFFAMPNDTETILACIKDKVDFIKNYHHLMIGDCKIIHTATTIKDNIMTVGSIAINTGTVYNNCADQVRAKKIYRHLRKWIKKNYSNKLNTYRLKGAKKETAARNHWISPAAIAWKKANSKHLLKLYYTSILAYDIMKVSKKMGKITPVASNKIRGHG